MTLTNIGIFVCAFIGLVWAIKDYFEPLVPGKPEDFGMKE